jgi:hypothetical protein
MVEDEAGRDKDKGAQRQKRNGNETEEFDVFCGAGDSLAARGEGFRNDVVVKQVLVEGYHEADQAQGHCVPGKMSVFFDDSDRHDCHERVQADALVPAEHTWREMQNFTEVKASRHSDNRHNPGKIKDVMF